MFNRNNSKKVTETAVEGLLPIVQDRLQKEVFQNSAEKWKNDLILIVDDASLRVISHAMGMYKLMENRVYLVEQISKARAPYRKSAPLYFLSPTKDSVTRLIDDWTPSRQRQEPLYADTVFVYFTNALSDELFNVIKACKPLVRRLKALNELNIDFITKQREAFHLDMESTSVFSKLYRGALNGLSSPTAFEHAIADKLVTVCASLHEYPHIRYRSDSTVGTKLARLFNEKFHNFIAKNKQWWYHGDSLHTEKGRATLLILSRIDDCLSPLIHEFTYQAMVHDLLPMEDDKITVKTQSSDGTMDKDALLNESDELWVELRGKHIADVIQILSGRIREIVNSNTAVALNKKSSEAKSLSLTQMANALKALPEYQEVLSKLSQHMHISHRCMDIFKKQRLLDISEIEQTLATGKDDEGKSPKVADMVDLVEQQLKSIMEPVTRFRLLAIFVISQGGMKPSDQARLVTAANLRPEQAKALQNLEVLGFPTVKPISTGRVGSALNGERIVARRNVVDSGSEYSSSRYASDLKDLLIKMQEGRLSFDEYPSIYPMPDEGMNSTISSVGVSSVRSKASKYSKSSKNHVMAPKVGPRQIVFVAGGLCYSELRAAEELMEAGGPEIIVGSTNFTTPESFVRDIASL
eukprot:CAMPEP_0176483692 /NCGR_PEP_ID=MMETSP0200_2-20121128/4053_1 /TAXON_ID=947934 /ORGANISM="Chaetoceros sp., Strain GSL56" /LENGTH=637 /DNA_ID=CAMNT_0017880109 /DNA_START=201 /DNA_END=2114 /DNA_ORIENTATION=+